MYKIQGHDGVDKSFQITSDEFSDWGVILYADYDDVSHEVVDFHAELIVKILNENLDKIKFAVDAFTDLKQKEWNKETDE